MERGRSPRSSRLAESRVAGFQNVRLAPNRVFLLETGGRAGLGGRVPHPHHPRRASRAPEQREESPRHGKARLGRAALSQAGPGAARVSRPSREFQGLR